MSVSGKSIELQLLTNHQDEMSTTENFGSPPNAGDTDVGALGPLYQSINDAKPTHGKYRAQQVPAKGQYQSPGPPAEPNEYDFINEKQVTGSGTHQGSQLGYPPQTQLVSENVLYADQATAADYRHKTLTLEKQQSRFSGSLGSPVREPDIKYGGESGCKLRYVWMVFFIVVAILMALAALIVVVVIVVGVYELPCECDNSSDTDTTPTADTSELSSRISDLETMVANMENTIFNLSGQVVTLNTMLTTQQNEFTSNDDDINQRVDSINESLANLSLNVDTNKDDIRILSEADPLADVSFNATFDVDVYEGCTMTELRRCTVEVTPTELAFCNTPGTPPPYQVEGQFTLDAFCARTDQNAETNAISAVLQIVNGEMQCHCYVVSPDVTNLPQTQSIECGLFVVRCPHGPKNITTTFRT